MKQVRAFLIIFLYAFMSLSANAANYCNLLWSNNTLPSASLNITFDGNTSQVFPLDFQAGGISTVIKRYAENMSISKPVTVDGISRYWIQYPEEWQETSEGLKYRILSDLDIAPIQARGVMTIVTPSRTHRWENTYGCAAMGGSYNFETLTLSGVNIEIDRGSAWPGVYSIRLPVKIAYEENKGNYSGQNGGWKEFADAIRSFLVVDSNNVNITIISKCDVGEQNLSINMGDNITPEEAKNGVEKQINVSITCNALAKVSLSLKATDIVDGTDNKTKCGSGSCILYFDNGMSKKEVNASKGLLQVPIKVRFQDPSPVAGSFSGSAILSVEVI